MDRTLEINGNKYTRTSDFSHQISQVTSLLGDEMYDALCDVNAIIAGGSVLCAFTQQDINDIDVYFRSKEDLAKAFVRVTKDWDSVYLGHTSNSITLRDKESGTIIQFIFFDYFKDADEVFEAFDFTVCMGAIELNVDSEKLPEIVYHPDFLSDVASRTLRFNSGTCYPYISLVRTKKYQERGFKIGRGNLVAIGLACAQSPITSWDEAREQLGGVYGHEIDLEIDNETEFSYEKLHEVITNLKEYKFLDNSRSGDYESIFLEITGYKYDPNNKDLVL
jgi:hypothetical protein